VANSAGFCAGLTGRPPGARAGISGCTINTGLGRCIMFVLLPAKFRKSRTLASMPPHFAKWPPCLPCCQQGANGAGPGAGAGAGGKVATGPDAARKREVLKQDR
jgi:hypothetical protein